MLSSSNHRRSLSNISQSLHQELTVELVTSSSKVFDEAETTLREAYEHRVASHGTYTSDNFSLDWSYTSGQRIYF